MNQDEKAKQASAEIAEMLREFVNRDIGMATLEKMKAEAYEKLLDLRSRGLLDHVDVPPEDIWVDVHLMGQEVYITIEKRCQIMKDEMQCTQKEGHDGIHRWPQ